MKLLVRLAVLRLVLSGSAPVGERGCDVDFLLDLRTVTANRCGFLLRLFDLRDSRRLGLTILDILMVAIARKATRITPQIATIIVFLFCIVMPLCSVYTLWNSLIL